MTLPSSPTIIERREWRFVLALTIILLTITFLPYVYGYISAPADKQFMGLVFNVADHTQYFSWYHDFQSHFLTENRLTPEPTQPVFYNLLWWALAQFGLLTRLDVTQVFQLFRWFAGAAFIFTIYWFVAQFFVRIWERRITTLIITCGSGLGWVLVLMKYTVTKGELPFPLDVYRAGTNSFLSIMAFPHFMMANALIVLSLGFSWLAYERQQMRYGAIATGLAVLLGWQHVYDLITVWGILLVYAVVMTLRDKAIPWRLVWTGILMGVISGPAALYAVYLTNADPIWKAVLAQFDNAGVFTADPLHMLVLVGLPLWVAVLTFDGLVPLPERSPRELFIKTWFLGSFLFAYLPTNFQVHLTNCWQVPVGVLAASGLFKRIIPYLQAFAAQRLPKLNTERLPHIVSMIFVLAILPTSVYLWGWRFLDLERHENPYYLYHDELKAMQWLSENSSPEEIVFSGLDTGQYVPTYTSNKAFLAHWAQTLDFYGKTEAVQNFYAEATDDAYRQDLLRQFDIRYVLYSQAERALGPFDPQSAPYLTQVFTSPHTQLYRVNLQSP